MNIDSDPERTAREPRIQIACNAGRSLRQNAISSFIVRSAVTNCPRRGAVRQPAWSNTENAGYSVKSPFCVPVDISNRGGRTVATRQVARDNGLVYRYPTFNSRRAPLSVQIHRRYTRALGLAGSSLAIISAVIFSLGLPGQRPDTARSQTYVGARLIGGPFDRETYISTSGPHASFYYDRAQLAIASWNLAQTSGGQYVASFTQVSTISTSEIDWFSDDQGDTGWHAVTAFYYGGSLVVAPGGTPSAWWSYAQITFNDYDDGGDGDYLPYPDAVANTTFTQRRTQSTAAHEMALSHSIFTARLMYCNVKVRYNPPTLSVHAPQPDDIVALDGAY